MDGLCEEEDAVVALVREFVDRKVRPSVRELEHGNVRRPLCRARYLSEIALLGSVVYPGKLIEQMKEMGIFGLAIRAEFGAVRGDIAAGQGR